MEWFKKHTDMLIVVSSILGAVVWMNGRFNEVDNRFSNLEKEMAVIKTVMIMKGIMPVELATMNTDKTPKNN